MNQIPFEDLRYSALSEQPSLIIQTVIKHIPNHFSRILDLGCGVGQNLFHLAKSTPNVELTGIDISSSNIKEAHTKQEMLNTSSPIQFIAGDYLTSEHKPFNIIYAESVLHLITAEDDRLYQKLADDLQPNGLLIATLPYDCLYNRTLIVLRRVLRFLRTPMLDAILFTIAKWVYPSLAFDILKDRLHYMYIIPKRMSSASLCKMLHEVYRLKTIDVLPCKSTSIAKPKHCLIILQKTATDT